MTWRSAHARECAFAASARGCTHTMEPSPTYLPGTRRARVRTRARRGAIRPDATETVKSPRHRGARRSGWLRRLREGPIARRDRSHPLAARTRVAHTSSEPRRAPSAGPARLRLKVTSLIRKSEARETGCRPESRCEHANAPDADPLAARDTGRKGSRPGWDGSTRRKSPDGAVGGEGWATVGHRGRRVINPDVGGIEVWRIRARRWRKRPDQAVAPPTVGRTSAVASVAPVPRNALTPFSSPVAAA